MSENANGVSRQHAAISPILPEVIIPEEKASPYGAANKIAYRRSRNPLSGPGPVYNIMGTLAQAPSLPRPQELFVIIWERASRLSVWYKRAATRTGWPNITPHVGDASRSLVRVSLKSTRVLYDFRSGTIIGFITQRL